MAAPWWGAGDSLVECWGHVWRLRGVVLGTPEWSAGGTPDPGGSLGGV